MRWATPITLSVQAAELEAAGEFFSVDYVRRCGTRPVRVKVKEYRECGFARNVKPARRLQ
jgi:hypothetical protein